MNISDIDVESSVIGYIVGFKQLNDKVLLLNDDDFYSDNFKEIFNICKKQYELNGKYDLITVLSESRIELKEIIRKCTETAISAPLFDEHFRILKQISSKRRIISNFNKLMADDNCNINSVQQMIESEKQKQLTVNIEDMNKANIKKFVCGLNQKKEVVYTGFPTVDKTLGGVRKGTIFIIGARPSTGKTTFALNIAMNQINYNKKVMFFSLEMSSEMIFERLNSALSQIEYVDFNKNNLTKNQIEQVKENMDKVESNNNLIVFDDVYNAEIISNFITENKPDLVVIDFMQSISTLKQFNDPRTKIDYISNLLKRTAKSTETTIIILSQITRAGKEAPTMSDLKESGGLEQDGDYIALLHRPFVLDKKNNKINPTQTELMLDKNKFGGTGKVDLYFDLKHQKFYEMDKWRESQIDYSGMPFDDGIEI